MSGNKVVLTINCSTTPSGPNPSINYSGVSHTAGLTETFWFLEENIALNRDYLQNTLFPARAAILPRFTTLLGAKVYRGGRGGGTLVESGMAGASQYTLDQVNVSLLVSTQGSLAARERAFWIRLIPDEVVLNGEFNPTTAFAGRLQTYLGILGAQYWTYQGRSNINTIIGITDTGVVSLAGNSPFNANDRVRLSRVFLANGQSVGGNYVVLSTGPLANQFRLTGWQDGVATSGTVYTQTGRQIAPLNFGGPLIVQRATTHRTGRPFGLYVARRRRRRRV